MKKLFLFLAMASTTMFVSCGSDDSDSTPPVVVPPIEATAITLSASLTEIEVGQSVTFTVTDDLTNNVTSTSTFTANNVPFTGDFTPTEAGVFTIVAKNGDLTSLPVAITVTAVVIPAEGDGSIISNGETFDTGISIMYYLGSTEAGDNVFVANSYNQVGTGETATYPNDVYVFFTSAQEAGAEFLTLPTTGNYAFGLPTDVQVVIDANVILNNVEVLATEVTTDATWNLSDITVNETAQTWDYSYTIKLADDSVATGDFSGDFAFVNQAAKSSVKRSVGGSKNKVVKVTNAQLQANLNAVMAKK